MFFIDPAVTEAMRGIDGVLDAVAITDRRSGKTYPFVILEDGTAIRGTSSALEAEMKMERIWERVWDKVYDRTDLERSEDDFDSWVSAYDNNPIPLSEMIECRMNTVDRIKRLNPRSLLEIGCGTGLLLWKLHDAVDFYLGIDPSGQAVEKLGQAVRAKELNNVRVSVGSGTRLENCGNRRFDTAVMNSVVQYFPGIGYLKSVIQAVLRDSCDNLFVGDVKSLNHWSVFQTSVALRRAEGSDSARACVAKNAHVQANELSVSEELLESLAGDGYGLEIQVKKESHFNEMSRYRYDAIFHRLKTPGVMKPDISSPYTSLAELERLIDGNRSSAIEILNIPNSRLAGDVWAFERARNFDGTVDELLGIAEAKKEGTIDPGHLYELGEKYSLMTRVVLSRKDLSCVHALFQPKRGEIRTWTPDMGFTRPFFTNDPLRATGTRIIQQNLNDRLSRAGLVKPLEGVIMIHQLPRRDGSLDIDQLIELIRG